MNYKETVTATSSQERRKLITSLVVLFFLPLVFLIVGLVTQSLDRFWSLFAFIAAAMLGILFLFRLMKASKDDFYSTKIIYNGIVQEVRVIKVGYGTSSSDLYELVLDKKTLKIGERKLVELSLIDVPLPSKGEEIEIHALYKSGEIIQLKVNRKGEWKSVELK